MKSPINNTAKNVGGIFTEAAFGELASTPLVATLRQYALNKGPTTNRKTTNQPITPPIGMSTLVTSKLEVANAVIVASPTQPTTSSIAAALTQIAPNAVR